MVNEENTLDLKRIFVALYRQKWLIILISCVVALSAYVYRNVTTQETYTASTDIFILNSSNQNINYSDLQTSTQLTADYGQLIKNVIVTEEVVDIMGLNMSPAGLASKIAVSIAEDTHIIRIYATDADPYVARDIANNVREIASEKILEVMNIDAVNLINEARVPTARSGTGATRSAGIAFIFAFLLCAAVVVFLDFTRDTIKNPDDVERILNLTTLGSIPVDKNLKGEDQ